MQIETKTIQRKRKYAFLLVVLLILELILAAFPVRSGATESADTGVLADFKKDPKFNPDDYPSISGDYSLKVIQIAESTDGELLVYVYQPGGKYNPVDATSINISTTKGEDLQFKNYELTLLDRNGVLSKYKVANFSIPKTEERYYEITSIYREPVNESESKVDNGNLIEEVAFAVGKSYTISDNPGGTQNIKVDDVDVIRITNKFVGFMRYYGGVGWYTRDNVDVHFVAFDTDKKIDQLLEADVFYEMQTFYKKDTHYGVSSDTTENFGDRKKEYITLNSEKDMIYEGSGWFNKDYKFPQIESVSTFLESSEKETIYNIGIFDLVEKETIKSEALSAIKECKWVLRFALTDYTMYSYVGPNYSYEEYNGTTVGSVSILRLAFITDDIYYNLGVVDNKQTGSKDPVNTTESELRLDPDIELILLIIIFVLILGFLWNPLSSLLRFFFKCLSALLDVITLPIRFLYRLIFKE